MSRRLALLGAELASVRQAPADEPDPEEAPWWDEHTRIAAPRAGPSTPPPAGPPSVPVPGRHARRRASSWVPETLRGRVLLGPAQLAVVAIVVAVGLAVTAWWLVRAEPEPVDDLAVAPVGSLVPLEPDPTPRTEVTPSTAVSYTHLTLPTNREV